MSGIRTDAQGLPLLDQSSEDGFVDCVLRIENPVVDGEHIVFDLRASHEGRPLGVRARLRRTIRPGIDGDMHLIGEHVYRNGLEISSLGAQSDAFVTALAMRYGAGPAPRTMVASERYTVIALQQDGTDLETCAVRLKIFGRDGEDCDEDDYYESFFNVDLPGGFVYWNEKDDDYREPMLRALTAHTAGDPAMAAG